MKQKVKFRNSDEVIAIHDYFSSIDLNIFDSDTFHWYKKYQEKNTFDLYSCHSWYKNDRERLRMLTRFLQAEKRYYNDEYLDQNKLIAACYVVSEAAMIGLKNIELTPDNLAWLGLMTMIAAFPVAHAAIVVKKRKDVDKTLEKLDKVKKEIFMKNAEHGRAKKLKKHKYTYE